MTGENKRLALQNQFGEHGYDYVGNSFVDCEVWAGAREGIVVSSDNSNYEARKVTNVVKVIPAQTKKEQFFGSFFGYING